MRLHCSIPVAALFLTVLLLISTFYSAAVPGRPDDNHAALGTYLTIKPPHITHRQITPYTRMAERMDDLPMPHLHEPSAYSPRPPVHLGMPDNFVFQMEFASMPHSTHHVVPSTWRTRKRDRFPDTDLTVPVDYDYGKYKACVKKTARGELEGFVHVALVWGEELRVPERCRRAMIGLAEGIRTYTGLDVAIDNHLMLSSTRIHDYPMLVLTADSAFELTPAERDNLRAYIENGGFLFVDNAQPEFPHGQAEASLRQMIRDVTGCHARFEPIPTGHEIYHSYFDFKDGPPIGNEMTKFTTATTKTQGESARHKLNSYSYFLEGVTYRNRLVCLYSDRGYTLKWSGWHAINQEFKVDWINQISPSAGQPQLKFGVNLVAYALKRHTLPLPKYDVFVTDGK